MHYYIFKACTKFKEMIAVFVQGLWHSAFIFYICYNNWHKIFFLRCKGRLLWIDKDNPQDSLSIKLSDPRLRFFFLKNKSIDGFVVMMFLSGVIYKKRKQKIIKKSVENSCFSKTLYRSDLKMTNKNSSNSSWRHTLKY